jgi:hypothetical protein
MKFQKLGFAVTVLVTMIAIGPTFSATCTNANLVGVWEYEVGAAVGQFTADGTGNITSGSQTVSQNGIIGTQTFTGTYSVSTNCTGTLVHFLAESEKRESGEKIGGNVIHCWGAHVGSCLSATATFL